MKSQNRRALQAPMKSPSPDIANRSIITHTRSPLNEIKEYIKMRESSTSPKSLNTSFHQISKFSNGENQQTKRLKKYVQQLEVKIELLGKIKISHQQLAIINQRLTNQIFQLKQELTRNNQRGYSNSPHNLSPKSIKVPSPKANGFKGVSLVRQTLQNFNLELPSASIQGQNDSILRQFNERIVKMSEQNSRLGKKLKQLKEQKDLLEMQNMRLRDQAHYQRLDQMSQPRIPQQIQSLKQNFKSECDRVSNYHHKIIQDKLKDLNLRLNKIEDCFGKIVQKQYQMRSYNRTNSPYELKANLSIDTNFRSEYQDQQPVNLNLTGPRYQMSQSKYTISPSQVRAFTLETSPIRALEQEKFKIRNQNEKLLRKVNDLEKKLKQSLLAYGQLQKKLTSPEPQVNSQVQKRILSDSSSSTISKFYQQKCQSLQLELKTKSSQIKFKDLTISEQQRRLEQINHFVQSQIKNCEINIQQEREKNARYQASIQNYEQKIKEITTYYEQQNHQKQKLERLNQQLRNMSSRYYEIKQHLDINKLNFDKYLQMVLQIRHSIEGEPFDKCLQQIEHKWEGYDELGLQTIKIQEWYQNTIQCLKKASLQKDQKVAQLQRQNQIFSKTIEQLNLERQKLEKAICEFKQPVKTLMSQEQLQKKVLYYQSGTKLKYPCQMRQYVNRTVSKISILQKQIDYAINNHQGQSFQVQRPSSINRYYKSGVESDSACRSTIKPSAKSDDPLQPQHYD